MVGRDNALELARRRAFMPLANSGKILKRIRRAGIKIKRSVEDELGTDQPAGVVARRIIVVGAQMIGRAVAKLALGVDLEQADLGAAALIAVTNYRDVVLGDQHLVVPGAARINVR